MHPRRTAYRIGRKYLGTFLAVFLAPILSQQPCHADTAEPINQVRIDADHDQKPDRSGEIVTVAGRASVDSGALHSDQFRIFIQDETGGIQLHAFSVIDPVRRGDLVVVTGRIGQRYGVTRLEEVVYRVESGEPVVPAPKKIKLFEAMDEANEGQLVTVQGSIVAHRSNNGGEILVLNDPQYGDETLNVFRHFRQTGFDFEHLLPGDRVEITGIVNQHDRSPPLTGYYELLPRDGNDLRAVSFTQYFFRNTGIILLCIALLGATLVLLLRHKVKQRTRQLYEEKERLAVTLRSIGDGVVTTDTLGNIVLMNQGAEYFLGCETREAIGQNVMDLIHLVHRDTHEPIDNFESYVISPTAVLEWPVDHVLLSAQGNEIPLSANSAPMLNKKGQYKGSVIALRDASARIRMEEELVKSTKMDSVGLLAGGIAHDFNNLLTSIMGNANLALTEQSTEPAVMHTYLHEIEMAANSAKDLTYQLLTFAKGGAPVKKTASIAEIVEKSTRLALSGSPVRSDINIAQDLWPADVDSGQLYQAVNNMVINAKQAMPYGGCVWVSADNLAVKEPFEEHGVILEPGLYVKLTFKDQGVGISEKNLTRIFDPYFTNKKNGNGLGLACCYSIIRKHEGYLHVTSKLGQGTTFTIYLPASPYAVIDSSNTGEDWNEGSGRVLVMDDEESILRVALCLLKRLGYEGVGAQHGEEAIEKYVQAMKEGSPFDAVVMDLTITGGMGGRETISRLLEIDPSVCAIVASGYSNDPVMAEHARYGFKGVIKKPFNLSDLARALDENISSSNDSPGLDQALQQSGI